MNRPPSVLIVEDDADMLATCSRLLRREGYDVRGAESASAALQALSLDGVDVVVTDIQMQGPLNGIGLLEWIRQHRAGMPVILMTGYGAGRSKEDVLALGASDLIEKPFTREQMLSAVRKAIPQA